MLDALDADAVRRWGDLAVELLDAHRAEVDALNVFPVPDSDTGRNMLLTVHAGVERLSAACAPGGADADDVGNALTALSVGAARGAIGNSGFLLSQVLRGFAQAAESASAYNGAAVSRGLDAGARFARAAVVTPVEGTILTVARAAAEGALRGGDRPLAEIVISAVACADTALQATPDQLAVLAEAGVVDAGGRGLLLVLAALAHAVTGTAAQLTPVRVPRRVRSHRTRGHLASDAVPASGFGFEVQYMLDAPMPAIDRLRGVLASLGDSVAIVGAGAGAWKVHAHVDDVGAAIEAGVEAGRPHSIAVVRLEPAAGVEAATDDPQRAIVAVAPGAGLAHLFEAEGVHVVDGSRGSGPSADDVIAAMTTAGARELVLLPNASQVTGVAEAAASWYRERGARVSVVPTRSPVQGLAAIAVHDANRGFDDDVVAMAEAAAATRHAELCIARTRALTAAGICEPGDVLGLIDGEVVEIGRGVLAVAFNVVDRLLGVGAELMTVLVGAEAPARAGELVEAHVRGRAPLTDVSVYSGGQHDHLLIIGIE